MPHSNLHNVEIRNIGINMYAGLENASVCVSIDVKLKAKDCKVFSLSTVLKRLKPSLLLFLRL